MAQFAGGAFQSGAGSEPCERIVVFNFFPQWLSVYFVTSGQDTRFVTLRELGIRLPLLPMDVWWLIALAQNVLLLKQGRRTLPIRWLQFGLALRDSVGDADQIRAAALQPAAAGNGLTRAGTTEL